MAQSTVANQMLIHLHRFLEQLGQAASFEDILNAASFYAAQNSGLSGTLYLGSQLASDTTAFVEVAAHYTLNIDTVSPNILSVLRYSILDSPFGQLLTKSPNSVLTIDTLDSTPFINKLAQVDFPQPNIKAIVILPIHLDGQWAGAMTFTWDTPQLFTEDDRHVYTLIAKQVASRINSMRTATQSQERTDYYAVVAQINTALSQASDEQEILQPITAFVSAYNMASSTLSYFELDEVGYPATILVAASQSNIPMPSSNGEVTRYSSKNFPVMDLLYSNPDTVMFVEDITTDSRLDSASREIFKYSGVGALVHIPLRSSVQWQGLITLIWLHPQHFSEQFRSILTAIRTTALAVVSSRRAYLVEERSRRNAELTSRINAALSQASDEQQILKPLGELGTEQGADAATLCYFEIDHNGYPETVVIAASQQGNLLIPPILELTRFPSAHYPVMSLVYANPNTIVYVENLETDLRYDPATRAQLKALGVLSLVLIPLKTGAEWQGLISLTWGQPHAFPEDFRSTLNAIRPTALSVVASRRAFLAEQVARHETEILYRVSEALGTANTFAEILQVLVDNIGLDPFATSMLVFENYDLEGATYYERVATTDSKIVAVGQRVPLSAYSLPPSDDDVFILENLENTEQINPGVAAVLKEWGFKAYISVSAKLENRILGNISFYSDKPRHYSEQEIRLFGGTGKLVANSLERIRFRQATEIGRHRAETIADINTLLSQATNEDGILKPIADFAERYGANFSTLLYTVVPDEGTFALRIIANQLGSGTALPERTLLPSAIITDVIAPILNLRASNSDATIFVGNIDTDPRTSTGKTSQMGQAAKIRAFAIVPLKAGIEWQGAIIFCWSEYQAFDPEYQLILTSIQPVVASVVATRRTYLAEQEARRVTEVLYETTRAIVSASTPKDVINAIAHHIVQMTGYTQGIDLILFDEAALVLEATPTAKSEFVWRADGTPSALRDIRFTVAVLPDTSTAKRTELIVTNAEADRSLNQKARQLFRESGVKSALYFPLYAGQSLLGYMVLTSSLVQQYTEQELRLFRTAMEQAAIAINSQLLYKQIQRTLQATDMRLQNVISNLPILIYSLNHDGLLTMADGQALETLSRTPNEIIGKSVFEVYANTPDFLQANRRALQGETFSATIQMNDHFYQSWYFSSLLASGKIEVNGFLTDITELKRAEIERERLIRALRETSRFKDEFLAVMSHELRTPLNAIIGLLAIALMEDELNARNVNIVTRARANSERLLALINNILDISRMEAGRMEIRPRPVQIRRVIEKLKTGTEILANQKKLNFSMHVDDSVSETLNVDEDVIIKIATNLIANAIKFTDTGSVDFQLSQNDENLIMIVKDTGIGIPLIKQEIIFESFRQVDSSATREYGGSGLGLSIVKNLCKALGGVVRVESEVDVGSTFTVHLPLKYSQPEQLMPQG